MNPAFDRERPRRHVEHFARLYPQAWRQFDEFRARRAELGGWAEWCFCPLAGAYAVVSGGSASTVPTERAEHIGIIGALAAWRVTQGIYEFDPTVFEAVADTPLTGEVPTEALFTLPEWCVYVVTPGREYGGHKLHGFFAYLEEDVADVSRELRFVLDCEDDVTSVLLSLPVLLGSGTLLDALDRLRLSAQANAAKAGVTIDVDLLRTAAPAVLERWTRELGALVSLTLYLCAQAAEMRDADGSARQPSKRPSAVRTKRGARLFPPERPVRWEVAYRLGAALRRALSPDTESYETTERGRARPRAHVRRAHWHTFLTGTRTGGEQKPVLRWLPPVAVNLDTVDDLVSVVRGVQ